MYRNTIFEKTLMIRSSNPVIFLTIFLSIFLLQFRPVIAQKKIDKQIRRLEADAGQLYDSKLWSEALDAYLLLDSISPGDPEYEFRIGVIYYHSIDKARSLGYFLRARQGGKSDPNLDFYLARAYHFNLKFDSAVYYYKKSLQVPDSVQSLGSNLRFEIEKHIQDCQLAARLVEDPLLTPIRNVGEPVNSPYPEYVPLVSADENMMIFTSRRPNTTGKKVDLQGMYMEDIYISYKDENGNWTDPVNDLNFNTPDHDACVGLSADGKTLILYRSDNGGDLFLSQFNGKNWSEPEPFTEINSSHWESSACFTKDRQFVYFTSDKPGGFGGSDIYRAKLQPDGKYGGIENLGPVINTKYDEDAPQIHSDGKTLFFSSKGHEGLGGYDIYSTTYDNSTGRWGEPRNIGYPINTPDDDIYFSLLSNGTKGYFSSYRPDTYGEKDIYMISRPQSVATKFLMKFRLFDPYFNRPIQARITITNTRTGDKKTIIASDTSLGRYSVPLEFKTDYDLEIEATGYQFKEKKLNMDYRADIFEYVMNIIPKREEVIALIDSVAYARLMQHKSIQSMSMNYENPPGYADTEDGDPYENNENNNPGKPNITGDRQQSNRSEGSELQGSSPVLSTDKMKEDKKNINNNQNNADQATFIEPFNGIARDKSNASLSSEDYIPSRISHADLIESLETREDYSWVKEMMSTESEMIYLQRIDTREKVIIPVVNFEFNSYRLKKETKEALVKLAGFLVRNGNLAILISGYTDSIGEEEVNQELSELRALTVKNFLTAHGVRNDRVYARGYGEKNPLLTNDSVLGRKINRRVSFTFIDIYDPKYSMVPFDDITRAFNVKLDPHLTYQSPIIIWEKLPVAIHFPTDVYGQITKYSQIKLDQLASYFSQMPYMLVMCGFTDNSELNTSSELGLRRSLTTFEYLSRKGINPKKMLIVDREEMKDFYNVDELPDGIEQRRVQFFIVKN